MKRTIRALTTTVAVELADDLRSTSLAELLLAGYAEADDRPEIAYRLYRDGVIYPDLHDDRVEDPDDIVPMFELDLYQQVAWRAKPGWLLHAAALEHDGGAYVFAGPSGAGKTTLTLALMARGWRLLTEEMVLIDRELAVHGLARPIHAPLDGPQRHAIPASWRQHEYPMRVGGAVVRSVITQPPPRARITGALPLRALVRLDHGPMLSEAVVSLQPHQAVPRLWDCTLRRDADGLAAATTILSLRPAHELRSASPAGAVAQATAMTRELAG